MIGYRIFFLDDLGHIKNSDEFFAQSDLDALLRAGERRSHGATELWSGARVVAKFPKRQDA